MSIYLSFLPDMLLQCNTPLAPLRSNPTETAELESQILYGESVTVLELGQKDWIRIRNEDDKYDGWTDKKHFVIASEPKSLLFMDLLAPVHTSDGLKYLPFGSKLGNAEKTIIINQSAERKMYEVSKILELVSKFENAPYLWGGKTILGMDCSGLMQLIYKPFSIDLPRNASQQEMAGDLITFGSHRAGDVAFFANENNKVVHVGILSSTDLIWHASGCVRLDGFIREGIFNRDTDLISHRLYSIRRFA